MLMAAEIRTSTATDWLPDRVKLRLRFLILLNAVVAGV
jgi:hypothetical protein